jgi:hypothetical protein
MGLGHFLESAGKAVGHTAGDLGKAAVNVGKGAEFVAQHPGQVIQGAGKAAEFVAEHPGQTAHIAGQIGKQIIKDEILNPKKLAVNVALLAATGGAGWLAEGALAAKGIAGGLEAAKVVEGVGEGVGVATKLSRTARFAQDVQGTVEGIKGAKGLAKLDKTLGAVTEVRGAAREAVGMSRYGAIAAKRAQMAEGIAEKGGLLGKTSGLVAGSNNSAVEAENVYSAGAKMKTRYNQVQHAQDVITNKPGDIAHKAAIAADPKSAVQRQVNAEINRRATRIGYTETANQTANSFQPLAQPMTAAASGQAASPYGGGGSLTPLSVPTTQAPPGRSKSAFTSGTKTPSMKTMQPMTQPKTMDTMGTALPQAQTQDQDALAFPALEQAEKPGQNPFAVNTSRTSRRGMYDSPSMYTAPGMKKSTASMMGGTLGI